VTRLGQNFDGYHGETIDIQQVLRQIDQAIAGKNWVREPIVAGPPGSGVLPAELLALRRPNPAARVRVYISAGIHGDEPAGPLAALRLLQEDAWPADAAIWFCPCVNPTGFPLNRRENASGIDLNRDYRQFESPEVRAHVEWLQAQPRFDVVLSLHEDWESNGFYVYELNPDNRPTFAEKMLEAVAKVCPVDTSAVIEDWPAQNGVIRPNINPADRPRWPEAMYLITNKTRQSYTLEAPSDFPLPARVAALTAAVRAVLAAV
jgi:predicted deacylase